jgi:peptide/nickel transport system substrate-binding protein
MIKKTIWMLVSLLMVTSLVMASCGPAEEEAEVEVGEEEVEVGEGEVEVGEEEEVEEVVLPSDVPRYGGTLNLSLAGDITSFDLFYKGAPIPQPSLGVTNDPLWAGDWAKGPAGTNETDWRMSEDIFGNKAGFIAESWEWSADFEKGEGTLIYHIRPGIHFALNTDSEASRMVGGREVTADDVVYTLDQVVRNPNSYTHAAAPALRDAEITKTGPWEVTVKVPADALISAVSRLGIWGRPIPPEVMETYGSLVDWRNSVGAGPFMLVDYVVGSAVKFDKNPNYWHTNPVGPGMGDQLPYIDHLRWLIIPDQSSREAALRTGKVDQMYNVTWEQAITVRSTAPDLLEAEMPPEGGWHIKWRVDTPPFDDVRVRQALIMATDFETIRDTLNGGLGQILTWPFVYHPSYADLYLGLDDPMMPENVREIYTYNPDKAKTLLSEAGFPNGFKTEAILTAGEADYYSVLADMWSKVDVELELNVMEMGGLASTLATKKHKAIAALGLSPVGTYFDAGDFTGTGITNVSCIDDPLVNKTFEDVRRVMVSDEKAAMRLVKELMPYFLEQAFALPRPVAPSFNFWWPWIKNYTGEIYLGFGVGSANYWPTYIWLDQDLKKSMGY